MLEDLQQAPTRKIPPSTATDRLLGGMDITESMRLGKPVLATGVLSECHQRTVVMPMAERLPKEYSGHWCAALDFGKINVARDGLTSTTNAAITLIALDEGIDEEAPPAALLERLALNIHLDPISIHGVDDTAFSPSDIVRVRNQISLHPANDATIKLLAELAASLGVHSTRSLLFSVTVCRAIALLLELPETHEDVIASVIRLVLLPRATQLPQQEAPEPPMEEQQPETTEENESKAQPTAPPGDTEEMVQAATATLPPEVLTMLLSRAERSRQRQNKAGSAGHLSQDKQRGRPVGVRRGDIKRGHRVDIPATLRTAAPFQSARARWDNSNNSKRGLYIEPADIRVKRFEQRKSSVMIFVVDASGSSAYQRMAEAKGAIELILADCYSHRTEVALIAFKGESAELLLPPTRSLVRAKRTLAQLPGGGGTPMGAALQAMHELAMSVAASGATPSFILLTDGAANVARDGTKSRSAGTEDAINAAKAVAGADYRGILIDTAIRPSSRAHDLATALDAVYLPLPNASAESINDSVRALN
jgi:magnesium chelatase subunit D